MANQVRLSQCMIVKNEEKNIERALSWAKEIAFEQIVVDTGSTDRTVEIAEQMGAKVYHFEWIDDFSAAKNFALRQAKGNWIAFLDADEYFEKEDTKNLLPLLEKLEQSHHNPRIATVIKFPMMHLDDEGQVFMSGVQSRIFQNRSWLRYQNRVHEQLAVQSEFCDVYMYHADETLTIYHTGYTNKVFEETQKHQRNLKMLQRAIEDTPNKGDLWLYLGDSYQSLGRIEDAVMAWHHALSLNDPEMQIELRNKAIASLMRYYLVNKDPEKQKQVMILYEQYVRGRILHPDLEYCMGFYELEQNHYIQSKHHFLQALKALEQNKDDQVQSCATGIEAVYKNLGWLSKQLNQDADMVRYYTILLKTNKQQPDLLCDILRVFRKSGEKTEGVYEFLTQIYDFQDLRDVLLVLKCAVVAGDMALKDLIVKYHVPERSHAAQTE